MSNTKTTSSKLDLQHICIVSNRIVREGEPIGMAYKEKPDFDEDSGWRILAGAESQKYLDQEENLEIWTLEELLAKEKLFMDYLEMPVGTELVSSPEGGIEVVK